MADRWEQFKRAQDFANAWAAGGLRTAGNIAIAPVEAARRIMERGPVHPDDVDSSLVSDALAAGPGALMPGAGRAVGGVGALGGRITPEAVIQHLEQTPGVTIRQVKTVGKDGTVYVKFDPPNPRQPGESVPTVRIPTDEVAHRGRPPSAGELGGNYFDTGERWTENFRRPDPRAAINQGGQPYSDPAALEAALKWRTSAAPNGENWLVRPDQAPQGLRSVERPVLSQAEQPLADPNQLKLLSRGIPVTVWDQFRRVDDGAAQ